MVVLFNLMMLFGYLRGRSHGLALSYSETYYLLKNYTLKSDFLRGYKSLKRSTNIDIKEALNLYYSGLNLTDLSNELLQNPEKNQQEVINLLLTEK